MTCFTEACGFTFFAPAVLGAGFRAAFFAAAAPCFAFTSGFGFGLGASFVAGFTSGLAAGFPLLAERFLPHIGHAARKIHYTRLPALYHPSMNLSPPARKFKICTPRKYSCENGYGCVPGRHKQGKPRRPNNLLDKGYLRESYA